MSFQEDIKQFIITFLIGLVPILMVDTFIVDRIGEILVINSRYSFELFRVVYFVFPFLIFLVFCLVIIVQKEVRFTYYVLVGFIIAIAIFTFFALKLADHISFQLVIPLVFLANLLLSVWVFWKKDKSVTFEQAKKRRKLIFEYGSILFVLLFVGYHLLKTKDSDDSNLAYRTQAFSSLTSSQYIVDEKKVDIFQKRDDLIKNNESIDEEIKQSWSDLINHTIYIGILVYILGIGILLNGWLLLRFYNIQKNEVENTSIDAQLIKSGENFNLIKSEGQDDLEILKLVKGMIMLLAIMITPIFYSVNSPKEIKHKPFLNLTINSPDNSVQTKQDIELIIQDSMGAKYPVKEYLDSIKSIAIHVNENKNTLESIAKNLITLTQINSVMEQNPSIDSIKDYVTATWEDQSLFYQRIRNTTIEDYEPIIIKGIDSLSMERVKQNPLDR